MPDWLSNALEYIFDFSNVLNSSITASWLILVVMLLRLVLKKAPKWTHVALWGIVALRLLMPFSIESAFSLIPSAQTVSDQLLQAGPVPGAEAAYLEIVTNPSFGSMVTVELDRNISSFQWDIMLMVIPWMIGMALMVLYTAVSYWRLRKKVSTAVILRGNIFQSEYVGSPFVLGIIKPRIYLPYSMDKQNMEHVISHEQAHIRRKDHWWKPLGFLLLTIHWFNPLMWVAYILLCRDIELACDEKVISKLGNEQRADYTQALVACSVNRRMIAACPLAFGEVGVKDRVKSIMNYRKPAFWIIVTAIITCVIVAVCFLTNPKMEPELQIFEQYYSEIGKQVQVMQGNSHDGRSGSSVYVKFSSSSGPTRFSVEIWYKTSEDMEWIRTEPVIMAISDAFGCNIPSNCQYAVMATPFDGNNGYASFEVKENISADVTMWFDYTEDPSKMSYEDELKIQLDEFPNITFKYTPYDIVATTSWEDSNLVGNTILISGMPIWNAYFSDLTGDGLPEICAQLSYGSGMIDNRVIIFDYANGISYKLEDRGSHDYYLRMNDADGYLYVDKRVYNSDELVSSGRLVFKDGCIQLEGVSSEPLEIPAPEVSFEGNLNLGLNAEIVDIDYDQNILYVKDIDKSAAVFGDRCAIDCSYAISRYNLLYVNYGDPNDVRTIDFADFEVGDSVIIGMYGNEKDKAFNGSAVAEQIQLATQRLSTETAFELNFAGNTSLQHRITLTEDKPFWIIGIINDGSDAVVVEVAGDVYLIKAGSSDTIYNDEKWKPGTYSVSFATNGSVGMEGSAVCEVSSVMLEEKEVETYYYTPAYEPLGVSGNNVRELSTVPDYVKWQDGLGFGELAPGEEIISDYKIVIEEDGSTLLLMITWGMQDLVMEYGIRAEDGTEYFQEKAGGASHLRIDDIPAGAYRLYVKNSDAYKGIPAYENPEEFDHVSFNTTGAMLYSLVSY